MLNTLQVMASVLVGRLDIKSEKGATAVEYGIMVAAIAVVVLAAAILLGDEIVALFGEITAAIAAR